MELNGHPNHKHFNEQQVEFMEACGQLKLTLYQATARLFDKEVLSQVSLWMRLIDEECNKELRDNLLKKLFSLYHPGSHSERLEILKLLADDAADTIYVVCGLMNCLGIPIDKVFAEVHRSNMTKAVLGPDGKCTVIKREDGKILKPAGWEPPNIAAILAEEYAKTMPHTRLTDKDAPGT